jgi:hypothetical protein
LVKRGKGLLVVEAGDTKPERSNNETALLLLIAYGHDDSGEVGGGESGGDESRYDDRGRKEKNRERGSETQRMRLECHQCDSKADSNYTHLNHIKQAKGVDRQPITFAMASLKSVRVDEAQGAGGKKKAVASFEVLL